MTEIPASILSRATAAISEISSLMENSPSLGAAATEIIARALMEERERCATIARGFWIDGGDGTFDEGAEMAAQIIADRIDDKPDHPEDAESIRSGEQP